MPIKCKKIDLDKFPIILSILGLIVYNFSIKLHELLYQIHLFVRMINTQNPNSTKSMVEKALINNSTSFHNSGYFLKIYLIYQQKCNRY